jgi:hypothetical protein
MSSVYHNYSGLLNCVDVLQISQLLNQGGRAQHMGADQKKAGHEDLPSMFHDSAVLLRATGRPDISVLVPAVEVPHGASVTSKSNWASSLSNNVPPGASNIPMRMRSLAGEPGVASGGMVVEWSYPRSPRKYLGK